LILIDANLLIYASDKGSSHHGDAKDWLDRQLLGVTRVGLPWASLLAFLRVTTNPRIYQRPARMADAWRQVTGWLGCDPVWVPEATERHAQILGQLIALPNIRGKLVPDADLAALAIEHGLILCSTDGDFARFPGLRWQNPLAA